MNKRSGKDSKQKILNAAIKIFSEYGYKGASIRTIAGVAGISVGGVYLYFRNKEDLWLSLTKERFGEVLNLVKAAIKDIDDPVEAVATFIKVHIEYAKNHAELILTHGREQGLAFGIDVKKEFFKEQRSIIKQIIRKGIDSRSFDECNAGEAAKIILGTIRGFILSIIVDPDNLFSPDECSKFILSGLLRRGEGALDIERHNKGMRI